MYFLEARTRSNVIINNGIEMSRKDYPRILCQTVPSRSLGTFASESSYVSFGRNGKLAKREHCKVTRAEKRDTRLLLERIHFLPQFAAHKHQQFFLCCVSQSAGS